MRFSTKFALNFTTSNAITFTLKYAIFLGPMSKHKILYLWFHNIGCVLFHWSDRSDRSEPKFAVLFHRSDHFADLSDPSEHFRRSLRALWASEKEHSQCFSFRRCRPRPSARDCPWILPGHVSPQKVAKTTYPNHLPLGLVIRSCQLRKLVTCSCHNFCELWLFAR